MASDPPPKKRKLQPFSSGSKTPLRKFEDGRTLKVERKQGEWPAHVYLKVDMPPTFLKILQQAAQTLQQKTGVEVHLNIKKNLHISLSRDLYIRSSQRAALKQAGQALASQQPEPFILSFSELRKLVNENDSRAFLAIEVGGGHNEVLNLVRRLDDLLVGPPLGLPRTCRYYDPPILHASFAWSVPNSINGAESTATAPAAEAECGAHLPYPTASQLWTDDVVQQAQDEVQAILRKHTFEATQISVRIGPESHDIPFSA